MWGEKVYNPPNGRKGHQRHKQKHGHKNNSCYADVFSVFGVFFGDFFSDFCLNEASGLVFIFSRLDVVVNEEKDRHSDAG